MILVAIMVAVIILICSCVAVAQWLAPRDVKGCVCDKCSWFVHRRSFELCYFYAPYIPLYKAPTALDLKDFKFNPSLLKKFKAQSLPLFYKTITSADLKDSHISQIEIDLIGKMSDEITREIDNDIFIQWLIEDAVRSGFAKAEAEFAK